MGFAVNVEFAVFGKGVVELETVVLGLLVGVL